MKRNVCAGILLALAAMNLVLPVRQASASPKPVQRLDQNVSLSPGVYVLDLQSGNIRRVGPTGQYDSIPLTAWAPDDRNLAIAPSNSDTGGGGLQIVDASTGSSTDVLSPDAGRVSGLHWSPDGSQLAYSYTGAIGTPDADHSIFKILRISDGTSRVLPQAGNIFAWTPDGTAITAINRYSSATDQFATRIINVDAETGAVTATILDGPLAGCQLGLAWSPDGAYLAYSGHGFHEGCVVPPGDLGVYSWQAGSGTTQHLYSGTATAPVWSTGGRVLAEVSQPAALSDVSQNPISLQSFAPDGSDAQTIASALPNSFPYPDPAFQVAGNTVMYATATCQGAGAYVTGLDASPPVNVTSPTTYALSPHLSPDGLTVAFSGVGSKGAYLALSRTDRSVTTTPVSGAPGIHALDFSPDGDRLAFAITSQTFDLCGMP